jgi:hypothetical protein
MTRMSSNRHFLALLIFLAICLYSLPCIAALPAETSRTYPQASPAPVVNNYYNFTLSPVAGPLGIVVGVLSIVYIVYKLGGG